MDYLLSKVLKKTKKLLGKLTSSRYFFLSLGIFFLLFGGINYYRIRILSFTQEPQASTSEIEGEVPATITIPSINIELPVEAGEIVNGVWQISYDNATFLKSSSGIGGGGNIVIYGHNKKAIFGNLPYLSIGQKIILKTHSGEIKTYEAYEKHFVNPDRIDLVSPGKKEELTLYTCWGLIDFQRAVIKAKPVY